MQGTKQTEGRGAQLHGVGLGGPLMTLAFLSHCLHPFNLFLQAFDLGLQLQVAAFGFLELAARKKMR